MGRRRRMAKHSVAMAKKRWPIILAAFLSVSTVTVLFMRLTNSDSCNTKHFTVSQDNNHIRSNVQPQNAASSPLNFMKSKLVLMVSHELSLSGFFFILFFLPHESNIIFFVFAFDEKMKYGLDLG